MCLSHIFMGILATELRQDCYFPGKQVHDSVGERRPCSQCVALKLLAPIVNITWYPKILSLVCAYILTWQLSERFIISKIFRAEKEKTLDGGKLVWWSCRLQSYLKWPGNYSQWFTPRTQKISWNISIRQEHSKTMTEWEKIRPLH